MSNSGACVFFNFVDQWRKDGGGGTGASAGAAAVQLAFPSGASFIARLTVRGYVELITCPGYASSEMCARLEVPEGESCLLPSTHRLRTFRGWREGDEEFEAAIRPRDGLLILRAFAADWDTYSQWCAVVDRFARVYAHWERHLSSQRVAFGPVLPDDSAAARFVEGIRV